MTRIARVALFTRRGLLYLQGKVCFIDKFTDKERFASLTRRGVLH